jgi:glyoxylase I family protein
MSLDRVLAAVAVDDLEAAVPWYERLFGRAPDAVPMGGLAEWRTLDGVVQLIARPARAGQSLVTLVADDLERELTALRNRGLEPGALDDTTSDKVLLATIGDPEGNEITLVQQR